MKYYNGNKNMWEISGYVDDYNGLVDFYINYHAGDDCFGFWLNGMLHDGFYTEDENLSPKENAILEFKEFVEQHNNTYYLTKEDYKKDKSCYISDFINNIEEFDDIFLKYFTEIPTDNTPSDDIVLHVYYHYPEEDSEFLGDYLSIFVYSNYSPTKDTWCLVEVLRLGDAYHDSGREKLEGFIAGVEWASGKKVTVYRTNFNDNITVD